MATNEMETIVGLLEGIQMNGCLTVTLEDDTPSVGNIRMIVESNDKPTQQVTWAKGSGSYIIDDTTTSTTTTWSSSKISSELDDKVDEPTTAGTANQLLASDGAGGTKWVDAPAGTVTSVQGKTGAVVLDATEIKLSDGTTTTEAAIDAKVDEPTAAGTAGDVLTLKSDGTTEWATPSSAPVTSVNTLTGAVVLTTENVKNAAGTKTTQELIDEKITLPTGGTTGQVLSKTASGEAWTDNVSSINSLTGDVVLDSEDIKMADGTTTIETAVNNKIDMPTGGTAGQVLTKTASGTEAWVDIPDCDVTSVNTKTGAVVLTGTDVNMSSSDTTTLKDAIDGKLELPTGTRGNAMAPVQYGGSFSWRSIPLNVNGKKGNVVLTGTDINMSSTDTTTLNAAINNKITSPTTGTTGQYLQLSSTGPVWSDITTGVESVNGKTGAVTLTGSDIAIDTASGALNLNNAILGVKVDNVELSTTDHKVNIPVAGVSTTNTAGSAGVVKVDAANGIEVDGYGTLQFNTNALDKIGAAYKAINAAEYDETQMYQVGAYATYKGHFYVCKVSNSTGMFTTTHWQQTSETDEVNNLLAQLMTFLGVKESARRWDSVNEKIIYDFSVDI